MELKELVREIHWTEWQLRKFEDRYGVHSEDFYAEQLLAPSKARPPL